MEFPKDVKDVMVDIGCYVDLLMRTEKLEERLASSNKKEQKKVKEQLKNETESLNMWEEVYGKNASKLSHEARSLVITLVTKTIDQLSKETDELNITLKNVNNLKKEAENNRNLNLIYSCSEVSFNCDIVLKEIISKKQKYEENILPMLEVKQKVRTK